MKYFHWHNASVNFRPSDIDNKCVVIDPQLNHQWSDENCNARAYFICVKGTYT